MDTDQDILQGLVTSAQKLNRRGILQRNKQRVDEVYARGG